MAVYTKVLIHFGQNVTNNMLYKKYVVFLIQTTLQKPKLLKIGLVCKYFVIFSIYEFCKIKNFRFRYVFRGCPISILDWSSLIFLYGMFFFNYWIARKFLNPDSQLFLVWKWLFCVIKPKAYLTSLQRIFTIFLF